MSSNNFANFQPDKNSSKPRKSRKLSEIDVDSQEQTAIVQISSSTGKLDKKGQLCEMQPNYVDFPFSHYFGNAITCSLSNSDDFYPAILQTEIVIDPVFGDGLCIPLSVAQTLNVFDPSRANKDQTGIFAECELKLVLPCTHKPYIVHAYIYDDDHCRMCLQQLSEICSSVEFIFEESIIRLHGLKI